jgi:Neurotransmitter-gated ion-channel ligand binding domain.
MRYRWVDPRLAHNAKENYLGEINLRDRVWTPHLYLVNEHDSRIMGSGRQDILISVQPDGTVLYSTR